MIGRGARAYLLYLPLQILFLSMLRFLPLVHFLILLISGCQESFGPGVNQMSDEALLDLVQPEKALPICLLF